MKAMDAHGRSAMEMLGQVLHRRMGVVIDKDHTLEVISEKHRLNR